MTIGWFKASSGMEKRMFQFPILLFYVHNLRDYEDFMGIMNLEIHKREKLF